MSPDTTLLWSYLGVLTPKRYDALKQQFGDLAAASEHLGEPLLKALGCREDTILKTLNRLDEFDPTAYQAALNQREISVISVDDEDYPTALKSINDPPVFLYYQGSLAIADQPSIALVGTRDISPYGKQVTELFTECLVNAGLTTVSGLAHGVDSAVAVSTLDAGGSTVAVLGHGHAVLSPKSKVTLAQRIVDHGGLVLSEYPIDYPPDHYTYPARNRIIAGLALGTIVLEAGENSGALITADLALDYGREVWAVAGQIFDENYRGCHQLLREGKAGFAEHPSHVLAQLGIIAPEPKAHSAYQPKDADEEAILATLTSMPQSASDIVDKSQLEASIVSAKLTLLELSGAARNVGNGQWVRR